MKSDELLDLIKSRRSIRKFITEREVPSEVIEEIIEAAIWAPTGTNQQELRFVILSDKNIVTRFGEFKKVKSQNKVILIFIDFENYYSLYPKGVRDLNHKESLPFVDTGLAMMNMMLMAESHSVNSVALNVSDYLYIDNMRNTRSFVQKVQRKIAKTLHKSWFGITYFPEFCKEIGINPKKMIPSGAIAFGYSDKKIDVKTYKHGKMPINRKPVHEYILKEI